MRQHMWTRTDWLKLGLLTPESHGHGCTAAERHGRYT